MRLFWIAIVATAALVLADAGSATAQITIGPYQIGRSPTYTPPPPYIVRYSPYPVVSTPATSTAFTNFNGGLVDVAMDNGLKTMGWTGYGPYASNYYGPLGFPRYVTYATPANYGPWGVNQPINVPGTNWKIAEPRTVNPGLHRGWFKGR